MVKIKRAYEPANSGDGYRILIDRLWPRGVSKKEAHLDAWAKELSPSDELRKSFGHEEEKFPEFRRRYLEELEEPERKAWLKEIRRLSREGAVTLVYGAKSHKYNQAVVVMEALKGRKKSHKKAA